MPFKAAKPEVSASAHASSSSSAAQRFYSDDQAATYTTPANASIQRDLSLYALGLAHVITPIVPSDHAPFVLLDLGAGSGLSTRAASAWLTQRGVDAAFAIAFDISAAMLSLTANGGDDQPNDTSNHGHTHNDDHDHVAVKDDGRKTLKSVACGDRSAFYCGNAAQKFPLRSKTCDMAIGISMLQWLTNDGLLTCYRSLYDVLQDESAAVFQIYPTSPDQVIAMETIARQVGFTYAEVVASFPHATMAKKWFLVLKKSNGTAATAPLEQLASCQHLCQFGRRHHRRCAWHLLQGSSDASTLSLRERLGREHVKNAWHVWRKFHRAATLATQTQLVEAQATGDGKPVKPLHFKAKRSLELWKSDEMIGEALRDRFVVKETEGDKDTSTTTTITYNFLLENMDEVVNVVHKNRDDESKRRLSKWTCVCFSEASVAARGSMENRKSFSITTRKSLSTLSWFKTSSSSPAALSLGGTATPESDPNPTTSDEPQSPLPPVPPETCVVLKHLVDFLIKHKLHKTDLFLHDAKPSERARLLVGIQCGELPTKLRQFSSRSVSSVVKELLTQSFAPLLPPACITELLRLNSYDNKEGDSRVACVVRAMSHDHTMAREQSELLASLLELLHKISLHATDHMNAAVLGKYMAAALLGSAHDTQCEAVATFLIRNSPEILVLIRNHSIQVAVGKSTTVTTTHPLPLAISQHETKGLRVSLDAHTAATITVVLTAIIESRGSKHGLFLEGTRHDWDHDERRQRQRVASLLRSQGTDSELDAVRSYSALALSRGLRDFLVDHLRPLLLVELQLSGSLDDSSVVVRALQNEIVNQLAAYAQDVLLLLLATVRLALDAGTDRQALVEALAPCLVESHSGNTAIEEARTDVLFAEMHVVMQPLCSLQQGQATRVPARRLHVVMLALLWIVKLRQRQRKRRQQLSDEKGETHDIVVPVAMAAETSNASTLSEWLLLLVSQGPTTRHHDTTLLPPRAYDATELESSLLRRLDDISVVMSHCMNGSPTATSTKSTDASDQLVALLDYLGVAAVLIPRQQALTTLATIQQTNRINKTYAATGTSGEWATFEILETFVVETLRILAHPAFAPLYPTLTDRLVVLLDVWGLADRSVALQIQ